VLVHGVRANAEWQDRLAAFQRALEDHGWTDGRNVQFEKRFSDNNNDRLPQLAQELVALNPEVIFVNTTPATKALQRVTQTIPIVFVQVSDPVGASVVASLAHPGGNTTGLLFYEDSIAGKWLGMLKEIAPWLTRVALLGNPRGFPYEYFLRTASAIAPSLKVQIVGTRVGNDAEIERAIDAFAEVPNGGLLLPQDNTLEEYHDLVISAAACNRMPAVYAYKQYVTAGGLMSYGTNIFAQFRQAADYVNRILRGANPSDLPVEEPTKYETVLNLKTAKALGFEVPSTLLVRADEVIE
jgi:putative tryptophan/tyrosine transport system substrate-binding protein